MNDFTGLEISASGMHAQRMRMKIIAENLANQQTTGPDGPYQRREVSFESNPIVSAFDAALGAAKSDQESAVAGVVVTKITTDGSAPMRKWDPSHPYAGPDGYVNFPNISVFREMTDMMEASRSYEANLAAARTTQDMLSASLELLKQ